LAKPGGVCPLGRPKRRWEGNFKARWMKLVQDRVHRWRCWTTVCQLRFS